MALKSPPSPLTITLTQGSADAFIQGSVLTGLTGRHAYRVAGVAWSFPAASMATLVAQNAFQLELALTRRSKTATPDISDGDVILRWSVGNHLTTSGAYLFEGDHYWVPDFELPIVEETIYANLDSTGIGTAISCIIRIDTEIDTMSDIDRLNLITRSLS